jgi:hypothetical protein
MTKKKTADKRRQEIITEKRKAARTQTRPEIEMLAVDRLVPYAKNAKKHDDRQVAAIAGSIREFGFTNPVLIDGQDGIIAGHGRVLAARLAGLAEIPCIRLAHLTDAQRRAYILADNRLAETGGGWDADMLAAEVESIDWEELESFGLDDMDLGEILAEAERGKEGEADAEPQIDRAEELNKIWQVKAGDLWQIGEHRLLCGDSTKKEDVARVMGGEKANLCLTDPPYGVGWDYGKQADDIENLKKIISKTLPLIAEFAHIALITPGNKNHFLYPPPTWTLAYFMHGGSGSNPWGFSWWNPVLAYGKDPYLSAGMGGRPDATDSKAADKTIAHSSPKPIEMWTWLLERGSIKTGEIILDPFLGSGTTMVAAQNLSRKCYGLEISPAYCAVILQRMADAFPGIEIRKADA